MLANQDIHLWQSTMIINGHSESCLRYCKMLSILKAVLQ